MTERIDTHEPGELIANVTCPCCGNPLRVEYGDDPGEIGAIGPERKPDEYLCSVCGLPRNSGPCQRAHP